MSRRTTDRERQAFVSRGSISSARGAADQVCTVARTIRLNCNERALEFVSAE